MRRTLVLALLGLPLCLLPSLARADESADTRPPAVAELSERIAEMLRAAESLERAGLLDQARDTWRHAGRLYREQLMPLLGAEPEPDVRSAPDRAAALDAALDWLVAHQSPGGQWSAAGFMDWCDGEPVEDPTLGGAGRAAHDVGVTGLALAALLGAGHGPDGADAYGRAVKRGLRYLASAQAPDGCIGSQESPLYVYDHAWATLACVRAFGRTGSPLQRGMVERAVHFILKSRNPYLAWRYGVRPGDNDTSVTGHMMLVLQEVREVNETWVARGERAPLPEEEGAWAGIGNWIDKMTEPEFGRVGYLTRGGPSARMREMIDKFPAEKSEAMTSIGILARLWNGASAEDEMVLKGVQLVRRLPPVWNEEDGSIDMMHWYWGTLAMAEIGGAARQHWETALERALLPAQRRDGGACGAAGSWDPVGPWGGVGGRVYSTALMALALQRSLEGPAAR